MKNIASKISMVALALAALPSVVLAQDAGASAGALGYLPIGVGIAMGVAALGGTLGQGKAVSAALESIGRNPGASGKLLIPMLLGLALIESLVIFAFLISLNLLGKA